MTFNNSSFNPSFNSSFNSSFNPSSDIWNQPSSSPTWGDMMKKGILDKPILGTNQAESKPKWGEAFGKAAEYLAGTGRSKYTTQGQKTSSFPYFGQQQQQQSGGGGYQVAPDIAYFPGQSTPGYTIPGEEKKGGIGSTIGGALGTVGGALLGGPLGATVGGSVGSSIGGLFG